MRCCSGASSTLIARRTTMTSTIPAPFALPPPLELRAADLLVGWIDGDLVRFRGFASQHGAARAAAVAHQAMLRRLARADREAAPALESGLDPRRRETDHASANANGRAVASVLRSGAGGISDGDDGEFAFEIRVPPPIDELRMRAMAYVMYRALRSSGVDWPLVRPVAPEVLTALPAHTADERDESTNGVAARGFGLLQRWFGGAPRESGLSRAGAGRTAVPEASAG
jgi:hypothetical protein